MRLFLFATALFTAALLSGCGDVPRSTIHGVVKYQGKPLSNATVIFIASDNRSHLANLHPDGSYTAAGVAQGLVKVSIQAALPHVASRPEPKLELGSKAGVGESKDQARRTAPPPSIEGEASKLPALYTDPEKSGLSFELKQSDFEWSIDLK